MFDQGLNFPLPSYQAFERFIFDQNRSTNPRTLAKNIVITLPGGVIPLVDMQQTLLQRNQPANGIELSKALMDRRCSIASGRQFIASVNGDLDLTQVHGPRIEQQPPADQMNSILPPAVPSTARTAVPPAVPSTVRTAVPSTVRPAVPSTVLSAVQPAGSPAPKQTITELFADIQTAAKSKALRMEQERLLTRRALALTKAAPNRNKKRSNEDSDEPSKRKSTDRN